jgi:hypothetical protein
MSTLRCTNLQDTSGSNSLTTAQIYNGAAKAWVNFNGTGTVAIRAQFNVSSITDHNTGDYTVNFTTAMVDANYSSQATGDSSGTRFNTYGRVANDLAVPTSSAIRFKFCDDQSTRIDTTYANIAIFR